MPTNRSGLGGPTSSASGNALPNASTAGQGVHGLGSEFVWAFAMEPKKAQTNANRLNDLRSSILAGGFQESENLFPNVWWLDHDAIMRGFGKFPKSFLSVIVIIQLPAKSLRDYSVVASNKHSHGSTIAA